MEDAALVALALGLVGQLHEVLHRLWNSLPEQPDLNLSNILSVNGDLEPGLVRYLRPLLGLQGRDTQGDDSDNLNNGLLNYS